MQLTKPAILASLLKASPVLGGYQGISNKEVSAVNRTLERWTSVLSQKFAEKVTCMLPVFSEPRQGRHKVAQGVSPGLEGPHPAFGTRLPPLRERGRG